VVLTECPGRRRQPSHRAGQSDGSIGKKRPAFFVIFVGLARIRNLGPFIGGFEQRRLRDSAFVKCQRAAVRLHVGSVGQDNRLSITDRGPLGRLGGGRNGGPRIRLGIIQGAVVLPGGSAGSGRTIVFSPLYNDPAIGQNRRPEVQRRITGGCRNLGPSAVEIAAAYVWSQGVPRIVIGTHATVAVRLRVHQDAAIGEQQHRAGVEGRSVGKGRPALGADHRDADDDQG